MHLLIKKSIKGTMLICINRIIQNKYVYDLLPKGGRKKNTSVTWMTHCLEGVGVDPSSAKNVNLFQNNSIFYAHLKFKWKIIEFCDLYVLSGLRNKCTVVYPITYTRTTITYYIAWLFIFTIKLQSGIQLYN